MLVLGAAGTAGGGPWALRWVRCRGLGAVSQGRGFGGRFGNLRRLGSSDDSM